MDDISLPDYMNLLIRRWKLIAGTTCCALALAAMALIVMPRTYQGKASLVFPEQPMSQISPQLATLVGAVLQGGSLPAFSGRDVYASILKSRMMSENVCSNLSLARLGLDYEDLQKSIEIRTPKEGHLVLIANAPTSWLGNRVPTDELRTQTADLAARIANEYIAELAKFDRSNALWLGKKNRIYIESQVILAKDDLARAEDRLRDFQQRHPTLIPPDRSSLYADEMVKLNERQVEAEVSLRETTGQLERAMATYRAGAPSGVSPEELIDNPTISDLRADLSKLEVRRAFLADNFTERHPDVVALDQQIEKTRNAVRAEVERVIHGKVGSVTPARQELLKQIVILGVMRDGFAARQHATEHAAVRIERRMAGLPAQEIEYARLLRQYKAAEGVYLSLLAECAKARIAEGRDTDGFVILDRAKPERRPASPRTLLTLAAAIIIGMCLGVLAASVAPTTKPAQRASGTPARRTEEHRRRQANSDKEVMPVVGLAGSTDDRGRQSSGRDRRA